MPRRVGVGRARRARRSAHVRAARGGGQREGHRLRLHQAVVLRGGGPAARVDPRQGVPLHALLLHVVVAGLRLADVGRVLRLDGDEFPVGRVSSRVAIVGPVYPFRAGIAYCTTRLAEELGADVISFRRQFPRMFYPGGDDVDPTLPRAEADFLLDILNPLTWLRAARRLRRYDAVIFVWGVWVWALPYRVMMSFLRGRVILQCHNIGDKEPAWWKRALTNRVLRRANVLVVHAQTEAAEARGRLARQPPGVPPGGTPRIITTFLPV